MVWRFEKVIFVDGLGGRGEPWEASRDNAHCGATSLGGGAIGELRSAGVCENSALKVASAYARRFAGVKFGGKGMR